MIPYGKQHIDEDDIEAVISVLKSDFLTQGPVTPRFEKAFSDVVQAQYATATNSATSALHIACLALGVGRDDIVWTSPISFVASANCAIYCGARVDFVDIDEATFNMSVEKLAEKLEIAEKQGRLPKLVIPVHMAGQSCDMKKIFALSQKYGFKILEDASHATGGAYLEQPVGCCAYSDIAVFSFHPVKIITSGEGGMAVTNDRELSIKMASLRSHGITRDPEKMTIKPDGAWFYQQLDLGFNYRMTDIHAALGLSQLTHLESFVHARHQKAQIYRDHLDGIAELPFQMADTHSSFHLYILNFSEVSGPKSRNDVFNRLRASDVNVNLHYIPIYRHPYFQAMGYNQDDFANAEKYYQCAVSVPIYPDLSEQEQIFVIDVIKSDVPLIRSERAGFQDLF